MNELVECVLAIGPRLTPHYGPGAVVHLVLRPHHVLPVTLHVPLLEIGREPDQEDEYRDLDITADNLPVHVLVVGQESVGLSSVEVTIPDPQHGQDDGDVPLNGFGLVVVIHPVSPI